MILLVMNDKKPKNFTPREVAVLVEELRSEFRHVSEGLRGLEEKLTNRIDGIAANQAKTLEEITDIKIRLTRIETNFEKRLAALEAAK
jgi:hypothetical protein